MFGLYFFCAESRDYYITVNGRIHYRTMQQMREMDALSSMKDARGFCNGLRAYLKKESAHFK